MPYLSQDDIAQIGTAPNRSAVGVLRISGANAFSILARTTRGLEPCLRPPTRTVRHGEFLLPLSTFSGDPGQKTALPCPGRFFLMPGPASYTREDVAEIHLPGSPAILRAALAALVDAGARAAAPGEFTFRAFANGRLSLAQAEAVEDVVRAGNDAERRRALSRLGDRGVERVAAWRERLLDVAARIEAVLDFPEEELGDDIMEGLGNMADELDAAGLTIPEDDSDASPGLPHVALAGLANAGKSSLFNTLLRAEAVIVSSEASTTRDSLRRQVAWDGVPFIISDNPGYDPAGTGNGGDAAARAFGSLGSAELTCWVVDASRPLDEQALRFAAELSGGVLVVLNKADLPERVGVEEAASAASRNGAAVVSSARVSAATGEGIDELRHVIARNASPLAAPGPWNRRELFELAAARESCRSAVYELRGPGRLELAAEDLRRGVAAFSRAMGEGYAEEALGRIFSKFCIGK